MLSDLLRMKHKADAFYPPKQANMVVDYDKLPFLCSQFNEGFL